MLQWLILQLVSGILQVSRGLRLFWLVTAIGERLRQVAAADGGRIVEIGDGAGELQNAVETAGRQVEPLGGLAQQRQAGRIGPRRLLDDRTGRGGVRGEPASPSSA